MTLRGTSGTLLYIEDDPAAVRLMESLIARHRPGVRLVVARDGAAGRRLADTERPDAIFVDLNLPDVDGVDLVGDLREMAQARAVPLVAISAHARPAQTARVLAAGARSFVGKPLDLQRVLTLVDGYVSDRSSSRLPEAGGDR